MGEQDTIAVIGAGVIGAAAALALAREGRRVLLLDRAEPGVAGASFGNAGHIAAELVQPLPSPGLLFGFYRELYRFGGALDLPPRQALRMSPWILKFAQAAFRRAGNTGHLAPLVRPSAAVWERWVRAIGRPELVRRHGHYEVSLGPKSAAHMRDYAREMTGIGVNTRPLTAEELEPLRRAANAGAAAGLWFADSAYVTDPLEAVRALVTAALGFGAAFRKMDVKALRPGGDKIQIISDAPALEVDSAVVCAGVHSAPLLAPFGLRAPLQAVRGYHIEMPGQETFFDAPLAYVDDRVIVTPMQGRVRATSYMEFAAPSAPPDARKPARLRQRLRALGYPCELGGPSWLGSRPVLPDYLPGIGRAPGPAKLFYAIGHQHIGLTLAPFTAELLADIVAGREASIPVAAYDLKRF
ncbi:MAG TPA: FAD-dependent oxidoreductase [Steroidobacteraceae bacterium]|jgi:D-amino-acid dehydrogenase|nr:FAD-dependent oxidoreductase [Steroidobacteraceae bacterium]